MNKSCLSIAFACLCLSTFSQQNVLFIAVDDLKPMIQSYGYTDVLTPNIDALAKKGTLFANASCQLAVCGPSRASILTGLYPDQTQIWDLSAFIRDRNPNVVTLPQHFKNEGFFSVGLGKVFDSRSVDKGRDSTSWSVPFNEWMPFKFFHNRNPETNGYHDPDIQEANTMFQQYIAENNITSFSGKNIARKLFPLSKPATEGNQNLPDDSYEDGARVNYAFEKMDEAAASGKPFFLAVGFNKPHLPFVAPKKYWDLYDRTDIQIDSFQNRDLSIPSIAYHTSGELKALYSDIPFGDSIPILKQKELIHGYKASVSFIDAQIGKLIDKLDKMNLSETTTIVLWGDHGWHLGDHNLWAKHSNFEQAVKSPLIIYSPTHGKSNNISYSPVELIDIFPTLCELTGVNEPAGLAGESLTKMMTNPEHEVRRASLSQFPRKSNGKLYMGYTLRDRRYRYTKWVQMNYYSGLRYGPTEAVELYDYNLDRYETVNLVSEDKYSSIIEDFEWEFKRRNITQDSPSSFSEVCVKNGSSYTAPTGQIFNKSGFYSYVIPLEKGLDSVVTINLQFQNDLSAAVTTGNEVLIALESEAMYQWYECNSSEPIAGATQQSFNPLVSGSYRVSIFKGRCSEITSECVSIEVANRAPQISNCLFNIAENTTNGTYIGKISAEDPNGDLLTFSIVGGTKTGAFSLDVDSGILTVADELLLDFEINPTFELSVEASDGEYSVSTIITVRLTDVDETLIIKDKRGYSVMFYPNPTNEFINIEWSNYQNAVVSDLSGKEIFQSNATAINLQSLRPGVYLLILNSMNRERLTFRIVKK